jgi:hypothetical protein
LSSLQEQWTHVSGCVVSNVLQQKSVAASKKANKASREPNGAR